MYRHFINSHWNVSFHFLGKNITVFDKHTDLSDTVLTKREAE